MFLLLAAKIDAGELVLHLSTIDIHELITMVSDGFMENAAAKRIHLLKKMPEQPQLISGDENPEVATLSIERHEF